MLDFARTLLGRKFFEHDVPALVAAIERLAAAQERANELAMTNSSSSIVRVPGADVFVAEDVRKRV